MTRLESRRVSSVRSRAQHFSTHASLCSHHDALGSIDNYITPSRWDETNPGSGLSSFLSRGRRFPMSTCPRRCLQKCWCFCFGFDMPICSHLCRLSLFLTFYSSGSQSLRKCWNMRAACAPCTATESVQENRLGQVSRNAVYVSCPL